MATSVVYASIFAAVMALLPVIATKLVCFDTAILDLSDELADPVEVLFGVQLDGGTDISAALAYCQGLVTQPGKTHPVLISDLYEGGNAAEMLERAAAMVSSGVNLVALLALSDDGRPSYDTGNAQKLAALGCPVFACTPDRFPDLMAQVLCRADLHDWAARTGIATVRAGEGVRRAASSEQCSGPVPVDIAGMTLAEACSPMPGAHNGAMCDGQLDLFSASMPPVEPGRQPGCRVPCLDVSELDISALDDESLIAAIPDASMVASRALAAEAGRRRLNAAIPALETLCRRLIGFGHHRLVPEQVAALEALTMIRGSSAANAVARILASGVVEGPTLAIATQAAAQLKVSLPPHIAIELLRHADPQTRANACRCARPHAATLPLLVDLLHDLHEEVASAAACALGRVGRPEARTLLGRLLRKAPTAEVIDAVSAIADEECCVLLGRIARDRPALTKTALDALKAADAPDADRIIAGLTRTGIATSSAR
jgi:hypothetical protein